MSFNSLSNIHTLDNIYKNRWQEYYLADGRKFDSREIYWRVLPWNQVVQIITYIRDKKYLTHSKHPDFKFFVIYRWAGIDARKEINEWAVGWSNGKNCFMTDIDFKTGKIVRQYVVPVNKVKGHIHPTVNRADMTT